jgi:hypothetical protein
MRQQEDENPQQKRADALPKRCWLLSGAAKVYVSGPATGTIVSSASGLWW